MKKYSFILFLFITNSVFAGLIEYHGYKDCVELKNKTTRVIISGTCGGRILEYSLNGKNIIYLDNRHDGWKYDPKQKIIDPCGGRFDIGPEYAIPKHPELWLGKWELEQTGRYSAKAVSQKDYKTGVQLVRIFKLAPESSKLMVSQEMINISKETVHWCYWGRTLLPTDGICIIPLSGSSRFPDKYVAYQRNLIHFRSKDPNIIVYKNFIVVKKLPVYPKLGFDSYDGRLIYLARNNLLFTKKFKVYPDRPYNKVTAMTACVFYGDKFCELEPVGPRETIPPGKSAVFSVIWKLKKYPFPKDRRLDRKRIKEIIDNETK